MINIEQLRALRAANYRFSLVVGVVTAALAVGSFPTKQAQKDLTDLLARCYENAVREPMLALPELKSKEEGALSFWDLPHGLHEFGKKARALFVAPAFAPFIAQIDALQALRNDVKSTPVVKAASKVSVINPNKDVQTCPCCFRSIAVQNGTMVHHGYQRPGEGMQTASCMGIRFAPLEVSDAGVRAMLEMFARQTTRAQETIAALPTRASLPQKVRQGYTMVTVNVARGEPGFAMLERIALSNLEQEVRRLAASIDSYNKVLLEWPTRWKKAA